MKKGQADRVFACIGAVVGAGFASGRELMTFFSRYGNWSWALIALSACTMAALCGLWMRLSGGEQGGSWCAIYRGGWMGGIGKTAQLLLLSVTGGAMLSAGGELIALVLPLQGAQWLGLALTLTLA
ncbi:MAG: hypothetical protein EOM69_13370, partial [Clostridia bacterium]|nr:hypothetical protein [Clostridia bacterium]